MQSELKKEQRLVPLRRFAREDLYSSAYLSLLVQRGKLKAKKIGRNFFTTEEWFLEYLEKHAKDEIREKYEVLLVPVKSSPKGHFVPKGHFGKLKVQSNLNKLGTTQELSSFLLFKKLFSARVIAMVLAVIVVLLLFSQLKLMQDKGRIAGEEENLIDYSSVEIVE